LESGKRRETESHHQRSKGATTQWLRDSIWYWLLVMSFSGTLPSLTVADAGGNAV
jgi:hypothetical protein